MPDDYLPERDARSWLVDKPPAGLTPECWWRGRGESFRAEVALARSAGRPRANAVRDLWRTRSSGDTPVLLVVTYADGGSTKAATCGPVGEQPPVRWDLELEQTARLAAAVLDEPDGHAAVRLLLESLSEVEDALPGVRNDGLLALHDLSDGVPHRPDWQDACERALPLLSRFGRELVTGLGFGTESADALSVELLVDERRRALAVFLDDREDFDRAEPRFGNKSPVTHALNVAQRRGLPWVVLTRGRQIRLYSVNPDIGVGRRGRALTSFGLDLALLPADHAGYLDLVFSPRALDEGGTLEELLESSGRFAADLGARLRDRVYFDAVPTLATAVARHTTIGTPTEQELAAAYEQTLVILFRLLFVAYGEDRGLLPYETNELYREHSLKRLAVELTERRSRDELVFDPTHVDLWERVRALFRAVERGHTEWGVPPYGGIEIYNKPRFEYRDECFVILLINAWELLLKGLLSKHSQSIYYKKKRRQPYRTLSWNDALTRLETRKLWPDTAPPLLAVRRNLELLTVYRDNAVHYYNERNFGVLIYSLAQTSIVNYRDLMSVGFGQSLGDEITWQLLPLGLAPPVDPLEYLRQAGAEPATQRAVGDFIRLLGEATQELEAAGIDTGHLLTLFTVSLRSTKKITHADVVVGVGAAADDGGERVVVRPLDPNRSHPLFQKNILEDVGAELHGVTFTQYTFQAIAWRYGLKTNTTYCWIDDDTQRPRWSRDALIFLRNLTTEDIDAALVQFKARPKQGAFLEAA